MSIEVLAFAVSVKVLRAGAPSSRLAYNYDQFGFALAWTLLDELGTSLVSAQLCYINHCKNAMIALALPWLPL